MGSSANASTIDAIMMKREIMKDISAGIDGNTRRPASAEEAMLHQSLLQAKRQSLLRVKEISGSKSVSEFPIDPDPKHADSEWRRTHPSYKPPKGFRAPDVVDNDPRHSDPEWLRTHPSYKPPSSQILLEGKDSTEKIVNTKMMELVHEKTPFNAKSGRI